MSLFSLSFFFFPHLPLGQWRISWREDRGSSFMPRVSILFCFFAHPFCHRSGPFGARRTGEQEERGPSAGRPEDTRPGRPSGAVVIDRFKLGEARPPILDRVLLSTPSTRRPRCHGSRLMRARKSVATATTGPQKCFGTPARRRRFLKMGEGSLRGDAKVRLRDPWVCPHVLGGFVIKI